MTAPRIGDTIHYTSHGTPLLADGTRAYHPQCRAAIVTALGDPNIALAILNPTGMFFDTDVPADNAPIIEVRDAAGKVCISEGQYTPGTWHHQH